MINNSRLYLSFSFTVFFLFYTKVLHILSPLTPVQPLRVGVEEPEAQRGLQAFSVTQLLKVEPGFKPGLSLKPVHLTIL